jgi:hypothetical protein
VTLLEKAKHAEAAFDASCKKHSAEIVKYDAQCKKFIDWLMNLPESESE